MRLAAAWPKFLQQSNIDAADGICKVNRVILSFQWLFGKIAKWAIQDVVAVPMPARAPRASRPDNESESEEDGFSDELASLCSNSDREVSSATDHNESSDEENLAVRAELGEKM